MTPPVCIPGSEEHHLAVDGRDYRIMLARPAGAAPTTGYPVIYLLDGNATFGTLVEAIRLRSARPEVTGVVPTAVVGIGYPTAGPYERRRRTFDFTAGPSAEQEGAGRPGDPEGETGGADAFLRFLETEVRSLVTDALQVDPDRQILFGHSLAGYFALRTLLVSPGSFGAYVAASPSIWWDRQGLHDAAKRLARREDGAPWRARVMLTAGEFEEKLSPWERSADNAQTTAGRRQRRKMVEGTREMAEHLSATLAPRLDVYFEEFAGEDHASAVLRAISRCLRFVLAPR